MASCLQKIPSGNESRARKEKMMKWVFQTLAKDRDWISKNSGGQGSSLKIRAQNIRCIFLIKSFLGIQNVTMWSDATTDSCFEILIFRNLYSIISMFDPKKDFFD